MSFQLPELLIILVIAVLVFGRKNFPPISRNGGPPTHPLPDTSPLETSHGVKGDAHSHSPIHF